jgi:hypothetical protein
MVACMVQPADSSKMMMLKFARAVSLAPVARHFSQAATAGADLGFGFQLSEESRAYVDLARKFTKVRSTVVFGLLFACSVRMTVFMCVCQQCVCLFACMCFQDEIIPVAAEYDLSMKYPQPVFDKAFQVSTCHGGF